LSFEVVSVIVSALQTAVPSYRDANSIHCGSVLCDSGGSEAMVPALSSKKGREALHLGAVHIAETIQAKRILQSHRGCLPAPRLHNNQIFGIDHVIQFFRADVELRLMETLAFHFRETGNTFEHVLLGSSGFATIEPANIAALLTYTEGRYRFERCTIRA
jgi:hypothetical protein